jgi:SprT protein
MDLFDAEILAKQLISQYNPGVEFSWSRAKNAFGDYHWAANMIRLSKVLTPLRPESEVRNTIMHEIAHSLTPRDTGHGRAWQIQMIKFGLKPERCTKTVADLTKIGKYWYGVCPSGHKVGQWSRKPNAPRSCSKCSKYYNPAYKIKYVQSI